MANGIRLKVLTDNLPRYAALRGDARGCLFGRRMHFK